MESPASIRGVLVTGGAGYIGSVLVGRLLTAGYAVRVLDNLGFGGQSILGYLSHPGFEFVRADVCSERIVRQSLSGVDAIVHLAAIVGDPACRKEPDRARRVNKQGSEQLYQLAVDAGVKRFIFASTCSNYGRMPDSDDFVDESSALAPVSLYAELKVDVEQQLLSLSTDSITAVCLRFATAYGMSPRPRFDLTVNEFTRELVLGRTLEVFGQQFWRPYGHVVDLSRACEMALKADRAVVAGQAFNIGDTEENYQKQSLIELVLQQIPEAKELIRYVERDEDPRDYRVNFAKAAERLGFSISRRVPDGIREYVRAIRSGIIDDPDNPRYRNS